MISINHMIKLLERFRSLCRLRYPEDIDPLWDNDRAASIGFVALDDFSSLLAVTKSKPIYAICRLIKSPRLLKSVLRKTYRTWEHLHGELDFDDILIADVLRFTAPEAFEFILENIREIRGLEFEGVMEDRDKRLTSITTKWDHVAGTVNWDSTSAIQLIQFIFPCWNMQKSSVPQGLQIAEPIDYWARYLIGELRAGDVRDQEILHSIREWLKNPEDPHISDLSLPSILCTSEEFAAGFEHFGPYTLDGISVRCIATALFATALKLQSVKANNKSVPGFIPLWRLAIRNPIDESKHLSWVQDEIVKSLSISLRFANDIYYYWRSNSEIDIHDKSQGIELRRNIVSKAKELLSDNTNHFIKIIDPDYMYSSYHFCGYFDSPEQGRDGISCTKWQWFATLLLKAGELDPQLAIPQVSCLVVEETHQIMDFTYSFKADFAENFFGGEMQRLMRLLSKEINLDNFNSREIEIIKTAREFALNWLYKQVT